MRAWEVTAAGKIENSLRLSEHADPPAPRAGEVLVQTLATALNPADYKLLERLPGVLIRLVFGLPMIPGLDFCGRVVALPPATAGGERSRLEVGQLVMGRMSRPGRYGPWGELCMAPLAGVVAAPPNLSAAEAASIGTGALTAYQALAPYARAGTRVFLNGGSGGTGVFAVQIAKKLGCHVTVACSAANAALCTSLGADVCIDYAAPGADLVDTLSTDGPVFDLVVVLGGHRIALHAESPRFLRPEGSFIAVALPDHSAAGLYAMIRAALLPAWLGGTPRPYKLFFTTNDRGQLQTIARWLQDGELRPVIDSMFAFEDLKDALVKLRTGRARGKIVVTFNEDDGR